MECDAIVLGAGMAGLAAAAELTHAGLSIALVEARGRIGGRVATLHDSRTPVPVELGAELVHEGADATRTLVHDAALALHELAGDWFVARGGVLRKETNEKVDTRIERTVKAIARAGRTHDVSFADALAAARVPAADAALARSFVEGFHAADLRRIGVRGLVRGGDGGPGKALRVNVGYSALADALAAQVSSSLVLGTRVVRIAWRRGEARVTVEGPTGFSRELRARAVVVALPLGVVRESIDLFEPAIGATQRALEGLAIGHVAKMTLRFRDAFWSELRHGEYARAAFFLDPTQQVPTFWTSRPFDAPVIVAWAGGPKAKELLAAGELRAVEAALDSFARLLRVDRRLPHDRLETYFTHDWSHDPLARGAYSYPAVGGELAGPRSAKPIDGTLFFAGEHTAEPPDNGTVHGAIESGRRAAHELLTRYGIRRAVA
ncbi:MAG TPA: NAD(P)/FAD-dependent oxidoreductase [Labilithrix sp.]|jgi:monoamine oxidase